MKVPSEQISAALDGEESPFKLVEEGDWRDEGKYSYCQVIVEKDGKFYAAQIWKTGSYYSDYSWWNDALDEIEIPYLFAVTVKSMTPTHLSS